MQGQLTEKADVYSFGLVTLEVVSGRRNTDLHVEPPERRRLLEWTWRLYQEHRQLEIIDPKLSQSECSLEEVTRVVHIALVYSSIFRIETNDVTSSVDALPAKNRPP